VATKPFADARAMDAPVASGGVGEVAVLGAGDARGLSREVSILPGTILGNPFRMRDAGERGKVVAAYWELLRGGRSAWEIARTYDPPLWVEGRDTPALAVARAGSLEAIAAYVRAGHRIQVHLRIFIRA
jgi:hypothetical protein